MVESTNLTAAVTTVDAARLVQALLDDVVRGGLILERLAGAFGDLLPVTRRWLGDNFPDLYTVLLDAEEAHRTRIGDLVL